MASKSENDQRLFLGIPAPASLFGLAAKLKAKNAGMEGIRWVPNQNLHITAYFFGATPPEMLSNLMAMIQLGAQSSRAFDLHFSHLHLAPKPSRARMIWARYQQEEAFVQMVQRITDLYTQINPDLQVRKRPLPHITLARLKESSQHERIHLPSPEQNLELKVRELVLWESILHPEGVRYEEIARFPLKAYLA